MQTDKRRKTMNAIYRIIATFKDLSKYSVAITLGAITKGDRYRVPDSINAMNKSVKECNYSSPWYKNTWGNPLSDDFPDLGECEIYFSYLDED
jgi:hypothetical protein